MRSRIFEKHGRTDNGQQLAQTYFLLLLKIGHTFAAFSLSGIIPVLNDRLKLNIKIAFKVFLMTLTFILSSLCFFFLFSQMVYIYFFNFIFEYFLRCIQAQFLIFCFFIRFVYPSLIILDFFCQPVKPGDYVCIATGNNFLIVSSFILNILLKSLFIVSIDTFSIRFQVYLISNLNLFC